MVPSPQSWVRHRPQPSLPRSCLPPGGHKWVQPRPPTPWERCIPQIIKTRSLEVAGCRSGSAVFVQGASSEGPPGCAPPVGHHRLTVPRTLGPRTPCPARQQRLAWSEGDPTGAARGPRHLDSGCPCACGPPGGRLRSGPATHWARHPGCLWAESPGAPFLPWAGPSASAPSLQPHQTPCLSPAL